MSDQSSDERWFGSFTRRLGDLWSLGLFLLLVASALLQGSTSGYLGTVGGFFANLLSVVVLIFAAVVSLATLSRIIRGEKSGQAGPLSAAALTRWISPAVFATVLMYLGLRRLCSQTAQPYSLSCGVVLAIVALLLLAAIVVVWFLVVFSRKITPGAKAKECEIIPMVRFCYVFTIAAFGLSMAPLLGIFFVDSQSYLAMVQSPIGLVKGCVHNTKAPEWELACSETDPYKAQWMVNVGGSARFANQMPATPSPTPSADAGAAPANGSIVQPTATPTPTGTLTASPLPGAANNSTSTATPTMDAVDRSIGYSRSRPIVIVHGGLVVPWYFIALAIMGAAVSLARKVPEYQRRAISGTDAMDGPTAREYLEFEVLQVLSAPLIALAAYNLVTPTSIATSVALGFSSGFSSEAILLAVRKVLDGIVGTPAAVPVGNISDSAIVSSLTALLLKDPDLLAKEPDLKATDIEVTSTNGEVTLTGSLHTDDAVKRAFELAQSVPGVKLVNNRLEPVSDSAIVLEVTASFRRVQDLLNALNEKKIVVTSQNKTVTLIGTLENDQAIQRAVDLARSVAGVKDVKFEKPQS